MIFTQQSIKALAKEYYGLSGEVTALNGFDEQNFLLKDSDGKKYILKVATDEQGYEFLDLQVKILQHLSLYPNAENFQKPVLNKNGDALTIHQEDGKNYYIRILSYLEGTFWADGENYPDELFLDFGFFLGKMDCELQNFNHVPLQRRLLWDLSNSADANAKLHYIKDHEQRRIAAYFLLQFEMEVLPLIPSLRHAYIHNDVNDYNVLVSENKVSGVIDFGDTIYTALIHNLAIACTYAILHNDDPLKAASLIVKGYHQSYPLTEQEVDLLYYLIAARLCISVTQSAYNTAKQTDNAHHFLSEAPAWKLLQQLIKMNPLKAQESFRKACGFASVVNENDDYISLLEDRKKYIGRNLSISYAKPLKIVRGALQYLYDDKGNTFVDGVNNVSHVGHCHPTVVRAMQKQIAKLNTNTRYLNDNMIDYAKAITSLLPAKLSVCYFTNSGSEANDLAIRMSRHFTQQQDLIVLDHAYHGNSTVAIEMSPYKFDGKGGFVQKPYIHKTVSPDMYRGQFQYGDEDAGKKYATSVQEIIEQLHTNSKGVAAFICETILGVGGQIPLPENYLKEVYTHVRKAGGVCIADEVQVGFGRMGEAYWGFELQGVEPDIVVLGKPTGNGHPLAAVIVTNEIADSFNNGMEYFNTFGGNPVSMATGHAVLKVIEDEGLQKNALETGNHLMQLLKDLMQKYKIIGDVRGYGLFIGAELVTNRETKEPAVKEIDIIVEKMRERGFLLSTDGPLHNVIKIKPPMVFSKQNAEALAKNLDEVLKEFY
ncbi:MAG: aminotransferase class III-fold pyridoxal phosphate-dependent enzyme [Ginsengibacter sp.]